MAFSKEKVKKYTPIIYQYMDTYPELKMAPIARKIHKEETVTDYVPGAFRKLVELVATKRRQDRINNVDVDEIFGDGDVNEGDIYIPRSWAKDRPRYKIPGAVKKLLILADLQMPFHDPESIRIAIKYGMDNNMDGILLNGDIGDFYAISKFSKDPTRKILKQELDIIGEFLRKLREKFPGLKIFYKYGNHEERLERLVWDESSALYGIEELELHNLLKLPQLQISHITDKRVIEFGDLNIIHGHEIMGGGINVARNFRIKSRDNILFGHFHRWQQEVVPRLSGKQQGAWSVGCLCHLSPDYMPINDWVSGFAFVTRSTNGHFDVRNIKIRSGRVIGG